MVIGDKEKALSLVLHLDMLFDGPEVIAQMQLAGRLNARKNPFGWCHERSLTARFGHKLLDLRQGRPSWTPGQTNRIWARSRTLVLWYHEKRAVGRQARGVGAALLTPRSSRQFKMPRISAGLLMYRIHDGKFQVLLAHPGGPFFKNKDEGAWSIPKGEIEMGEDLLEAAKREFVEETGFTPTDPFIALKPVKQKGGKIVHAWAFVGECDPVASVSNTFTMEWPPGSGRRMEFPEIDRVAFFGLATARRKIKPGQEPLITQLEEILHRADESPAACR
jgi:predicted NUDIX family NTP pyrophosphohydrolase